MEIIPKKGLTTFDLKILGIIFMFIDHIHQMFAIMDAPNWLDWFGRPVATLFFFISVEGFSHTRNKNKYLFRLLVGFWLMNIGTSLVEKFFTLGDMALQNNIFADLFLGVLAMYGIDWLIKFKADKQAKYLLIGVGCFLLPLILSVIILLGVQSSNLMLVQLAKIIPSPLFAENSLMIYLMPVMYLLRKNRLGQCIAVAVVAGLFLITNIGAAFTTNTQWMMILAVIPMYFYNGEKGKSMKSFFYIFYPAHIWILYIIASLIYNH